MKLHTKILDKVIKHLSENMLRVYMYLLIIGIICIELTMCIYLLLEKMFVK